MIRLYAVVALGGIAGFAPASVAATCRSLA